MLRASGLYFTLFFIYLFQGTLISHAEIPPYTGGPITATNCLDTTQVKSQYWDGNLEALGKKIESFFVAKRGRTMPMPCFTLLSKYYAVITLAVNFGDRASRKSANTPKDTTTAQIYFVTLLKINPHADLLDLAVPLSIQSFFDSLKSEMKITLPADEMFNLRILPPPAFAPPLTTRSKLMREKYHDIRSNYYLALDTSAFERITKLLIGETDPAFCLTNAEIATKVGLSLNKAKRLIDETNSKESEILTTPSLDAWKERLLVRINSLEKSNWGTGTPVMHTTFGDKETKNNASSDTMKKPK